MTANLRQLEQDRALLLAGVSHDLRTPLARLRLGIEMQARDEATQAGMVADIGEMDRIIGQFLEFARTDGDTALEPCDAVAIVSACVARYARAGRDVRYVPGPALPVPLRPIAYSRLVANLIDNALAYGAPPVEVTTTVASGKFVLDVADRGPGIAPGDVQRLKQPFTRASAARADAGGVAGAGLGLAIVDRIARLHAGTFELLPRDGGGTIARVAIPLVA
jgi:two-component system osmolarity sensor histidine kinase EnvZ